MFLVAPSGLKKISIFLASLNLKCFVFLESQPENVSNFSASLKLNTFPICSSYFDNSKSCKLQTCMCVCVHICVCVACVVLLFGVCTRTGGRWQQWHCRLGRSKRSKSGMLVRVSVYMSAAYILGVDTWIACRHIFISHPAKKKAVSILWQYGETGWVGKLCGELSFCATGVTVGLLVALIWFCESNFKTIRGLNLAQFLTPLYILVANAYQLLLVVAARPQTNFNPRSCLFVPSAKQSHTSPI